MKNKIKTRLWEPLLNESDNFYYDIYNKSLIKSDSQKHETFLKKLRFFSLFQLANQSVSQSLNYNFAECGCFKGQSSYGISEILKSHNFNNKFYIFDSFEGGLSDFNNEDLTLLNKNLPEEKIEKRKKNFSSSELSVKNTLSDFNFVEIHKGWIPEKFYLVEDAKFQFVHIDVDLYQPTYDSLKFFYPKLVTGGIIVCDDYNFTDFPGAKTAWDIYISELDTPPTFQYEVPLGSKFLIK